MSRFVSWLPIAVSDRHARRVGGDRILRPLTLELSATQSA
jgi:hypothetical protein